MVAVPLPASHAPAEHRPHVLKAALWMTGAIASFSAMAVAGRMVEHQVNVFELMTYRSLVGMAIVALVAGLRGRLADLAPHRLQLHGLRNLCHFTGQNLWFWAITVIPLAQVFALEFTAPLWVALIAPFVLGERMTRTRALAAAAGFAGILIVARPDPAHLNLGILAAAAAAIGFAGSAIFTKILTRTEPVFEILFWMTLMQTVFGLICAFGWQGHLTIPTAPVAAGLVLIGCAGLLAHFCLTTALSVAPASIVMPLDFARLPVIAVVGMLLYGEPLDGFVFLGAAIIFAANFVNIRAAARAARPRS
ncbi:MAG: EamA family transporter [Rhodobacteraceae bacterium]|nr:EamA family transporter [Paracoccaceae bacterium]